MKKLSVNFQLLFFFFLSWRLWLFLIAFVASFIIPNFKESFPYYSELISTNLPNFIWGFGNFDGVHYIRIAKDGYSSQYTQAFFPLYPLLINLLTNSNFLVVGLLISNISFLLSLFILYKLYLIDYSKKISLTSIILLLGYPTSFYFGSIYTESFFLLMSVASIYFMRRKKFLYSGFFAGLASATRLFGIVLFVVLLVEIYTSIKNKEIKFKDHDFYLAVFALLIAPAGLLLYMFFLKINFNDSLYFLSAQPFFGAERSDQPLILLPQVMFRYIKILISVPISNLAFYNSLIELIFTLFSLILCFFGYKKIRFSYLLFAFFCIVLPTLTGTLSSIPRYSLNLFLLFPLLAIYFSRQLKYIIPISILLQAFFLILFIRGYWIS